MRGIRFYQEFANKSKTRPTGNVTAIFLDSRLVGRNQVTYSAVSGVYEHSDSAVASTIVSEDYLREKCKKVSEEKARRIHPALFEYMEKGGQ